MAKQVGLKKAQVEEVMRVQEGDVIICRPVISLSGARLANLVTRLNCQGRKSGVKFVLLPPEVEIVGVTKDVADGGRVDPDPKIGETGEGDKLESEGSKEEVKEEPEKKGGKDAKKASDPTGK
jgi:hypothetical protein